MCMRCELGDLPWCFPFFCAKKTASPPISGVGGIPIGLDAAASDPYVAMPWKPGYAPLESMVLSGVPGENETRASSGFGNWPAPRNEDWRLGDGGGRPLVEVGGEGRGDAGCCLMPANLRNSFMGEKSPAARLWLGIGGGMPAGGGGGISPNMVMPLLEGPEYDDARRCEFLRFRLESLDGGGCGGKDPLRSLTRGEYGGGYGCCCCCWW
mmetsp:Transcript_24604/g.69041  ORF Transcript_24604/g.69041 Transcript_24604/m.69041 type:complete len:210 (-) Transcript_24604:351-980(-)